MALRKGIVLCECGGVIVSPSGKIQMSQFAPYDLLCNVCLNSYDSKDVYKVRDLDKQIVIDKKYKR